jgi:hypothetical protein
MLIKMSAVQQMMVSPLLRLDILPSDQRAAAVAGTPRDLVSGWLDLPSRAYSPFTRMGTTFAPAVS